MLILALLSLFCELNVHIPLKLSYTAALKGMLQRKSPLGVWGQVEGFMDKTGALDIERTISLKTQQEHGHLQTRNQNLTRTWWYQHFDLEHSCLENYEKWILVSTNKCMIFAMAARADSDTHWALHTKLSCSLCGLLMACNQFWPIYYKRMECFNCWWETECSLSSPDFCVKSGTEC